MANVKYGLNLRYATIWDLPIRVLAAGQCGLLAARCRPGGRCPVFGLLVAALCGFDLLQYERLAVAYPLYELVPLGPIARAEDYKVTFVAKVGAVSSEPSLTVWETCGDQGRRRANGAVTDK